MIFAPDGRTASAEIGVQVSPNPNPTPTPTPNPNPNPNPNQVEPSSPPLVSLALGSAEAQQRAYAEFWLELERAQGAADGDLEQLGAFLMAYLRRREIKAASLYGGFRALLTVCRFSGDPRLEARYTAPAGGRA